MVEACLWLSSRYCLNDKSWNIAEQLNVFLAAKARRLSEHCGVLKMSTDRCFLHKSSKLRYDRCRWMT